MNEENNMLNKTAYQLGLQKEKTPVDTIESIKNNSTTYKVVMKFGRFIPGDIVTNDDIRSYCRNIVDNMGILKIFTIISILGLYHYIRPRYLPSMWYFDLLEIFITVFGVFYILFWMWMHNGVYYNTCYTRLFNKKYIENQ